MRKLVPNCCITDGLHFNSVIYNRAQKKFLHIIMYEFINSLNRLLSVLSL